MNTLDVIFWNVYVGHNTSSVLSELKEAASQHKPHVIGLSEAKFAYRVTNDVPGYRRVQLKPRSVRRRTDERANCAILVRDDVKILGHRAVRMNSRWRVPGRKIIREPRIYLIVKVRYQGMTWKVYVAHWPFGVAQSDTKRSVRRWFRRQLRQPAIHIGDLNAGGIEIKKFAKTCKAKQVGIGVDRAIFKNINAATIRNLGKNGSDHPMILVRFRK